MSTLVNYGDLKTQLATFLHDDTLTAQIPVLVSMAEDRIAQRLRIRAMETSTTLSTGASTREVALPTRFVQARRLYYSADPVRFLEPMSPENYWEIFASGATGVPRAYTIEGENFLFGPIPDAVYSIPCLYYQRFAALSADADTNWLLTNARGLLLYASLVEAAPFIGDDERLQMWASMYDGLEASVIKADKRDRYPVGARIRSGIAPDDSR